MSPDDSSTCRCLVIAGAETSNGSERAVTEHSPCVSRATIVRRIGSDNAPNTTSRRALTRRSFTREIIRLTGGAGGGPVLHNIRLETAGGCEDFALLSFLDAKVIQRFRRVPDENIPIALADGEAVMGCLHVTAGIMSRAAESG